MSAITPLDPDEFPRTREDQIVSDRYDAAAILDELRDYVQTTLQRPSPIADRYDELHRQLGFFAATYGIDWPVPLPPMILVEWGV